MSFFTGTPGKHEQRTTLGPEQRPLLANQIQAIQGPGAGGAFGQSADYYRNLLSDNPQALQAMVAPEQRRFQQETIPGLAQQFASLGAGSSLRGSGFRNAAMQAGTDLTERIAALRANLQMQGAQGLQGLAQQGLGQYYQNTYTPRTPGALETLAPALGTAAAAFLAPATGGASAAIPFFLQQVLGNMQGKNSLQDSVTGIASGPGGSGATYDPYTGRQG